MRLTLVASLLFATLAFSQTDSVTSQKTIRLGIAMPTNRSAAMFNTQWERDQLAHSLEMDTKNDSDIKLTIVPLKSDSYKDAARECKDRCDMIVLVTVRDTSAGLSPDPRDGRSRTPIVLGPRLGNTGPASGRTFVEYDLVRADGSRHKSGSGSMTVRRSEDMQDDIRETLDSLATGLVRQLKDQTIRID